VTGIGFGLNPAFSKKRDYFLGYPKREKEAKNFYVEELAHRAKGKKSFHVVLFFPLSAVHYKTFAKDRLFQF
jgi:hypothetical protein